MKKFSAGVIFGIVLMISVNAFAAVMLNEIPYSTGIGGKRNDISENGLRKTRIAILNLSTSLVDCSAIHTAPAFSTPALTKFPQLK